MNYDYQPVRQNYLAHSAVLLLFLFSGAAFAISGFVPVGAVVWQILGLVLLLPAIQLIARYMASRYLYRLHTYEDGNVDLEIFLYRGGSRMQLTCCVSLGEITAAEPLTKKNARAAKGIKRYNYAQDLHPAKATVVSVRNADGACEILLCPDEYMLRVLTEAATAQKTENAE